MKSNIPKHPCKNKCTDFKEEQCKTCLIPSNSMELESPESDFLIGDVVVFTYGYQPHSLMTVDAVLDEGLFLGVSEYRQAFASKDIRHATVTELNAKRRLTEAEQALAEVS